MDAPPLHPHIKERRYDIAKHDQRVHTMTKDIVAETSIKTSARA